MMSINLMFSLLVLPISGYSWARTQRMFFNGGSTSAMKLTFFLMTTPRYLSVLFHGTGLSRTMISSSGGNGVFLLPSTSSHDERQLMFDDDSEELSLQRCPNFFSLAFESISAQQWLKLKYKYSSFSNLLVVAKDSLSTI